MSQHKYRALDISYIFARRARSARFCRKIAKFPTNVQKKVAV